MKSYFFDTSELVKVYHKENGTDIVLPIYKSNDSIFVSQLCKLEFISTIYRKLRNKEIDEKLLEIIKAKFLSDINNRFYVLPLTSLFLDVAFELIEEYGNNKHLITLDAIQLATFLSISDDTVFVCSDIKLNSFASHIGLNVMKV